MFLTAPLRPKPECFIYIRCPYDLVIDEAIKKATEG